MNPSPLSRRTLLAGTTMLGLAAVAGCETPASPEPAGPSAGGSATPPAYEPFDLVTPDLPGTAEGVAPGFLSFPSPPVARPGFPLPHTEPATALLQGSPPQTAPDQNPAYEVFRASAGNQMNATTVVGTQYRDKFQVTIAGGDLPDFVQIPQAPHLPELLEKHFTDLTDILGGDGVSRYPGLANIPTATWKIPTINGRLWGITQPRPPAGLILSTRGDLLAEVGLDANPTVASGEELIALMTKLTDPAKNRYAMGSLPTTWLLGMVLEMMEAPNGWSVSGGTFTSQVASPQMKDALAACARIIKAGLLHPNSFSDPGSNRTWWQAGTTVLYRQGFAGWPYYAGMNPSWNVGFIRLPKWEGGGPAPVFASAAGYPDFVAIRKQSSESRLHELLALADFIASPFGTQQYLDFTFGKLGETYTMVNGNPQLVEARTGDRVSGWGYLGSRGASVLFNPGQEDLTRAQHAYLTEVIPDAVTDASQGLYSEAEVTKGATFLKPMADVQRSVMLGESPMSAWDDFVARWKSEIGDTIAAEYAEAAAG